MSEEIDAGTYVGSNCPMGHSLGTVPWDSTINGPNGTDGTLGTGGTERRSLPARRGHELVSFTFAGQHFVGCIGKFSGGAVIWILF